MPCTQMIFDEKFKDFSVLTTSDMGHQYISKEKEFVIHAVSLSQVTPIFVPNSSSCKKSLEDKFSLRSKGGKSRKTTNLATM